MTRFNTLAAVCLAIAGAVIVPASQAVQIGEKSNGLSYCDEHFTNAYEKMQAIDVNPGRDLTKTGASDSEVCDRAAGLRKAYRELTAPEPTAAPESSPTPAPAPASTVSGGWDSVAACESGGDWSINTGNGYYGGLQFDSGTWDAYGDPSCAEASDCSRESQIAAANRLPYDGWPNC